VNKIDLSPHKRFTHYVPERPSVDNLWNPTSWVAR